MHLSQAREAEADAWLPPGQHALEQGTHGKVAVLLHSFLLCYTVVSDNFRMELALHVHLIASPCIQSRP